MANPSLHEAYFASLKSVLDGLDRSNLASVIDVIRAGWKADQQFIAFGNGGSGLAALHFVHDWNKCITATTGIPFRGRTLNDNIGLVTAFANDVSYDDVFAEQLKSTMRPGDVVMGISGSGNSENVLRAIEYANNHGGVTIGLSGYPGGKLEILAQHNLSANIHDMQIAEDIQMVFGHLVMRELCNTSAISE